MFSDYEYTEYGTPLDHGPNRGTLWRVLGWVSIGLAVILVGTSLFAYGAYRKLQGNITHEDVSAELGSHRPPKLNQALNVLLIGSITRLISVSVTSTRGVGRGRKRAPARLRNTR